MADQFDITQQPSPANVNKPESGTYGEKAALDRLESALPMPGTPAEGASAAPAMAPTPPLAPRSAPGALPSALLAPTNRPDVPASTPLAMPPVNPVLAAQTGRQRRMAILDALIHDPSTSAETREWAQVVQAGLIEASRNG